MTNQAFRRKNQSGSAIIWVFIFVALFGALIFALSQGTRNGAASISDSQADLIATEMIGFGTKVQDAVKQLQINGCTDATISMESEFNKNTPTITGNPSMVYSNTASPTDKSCHVFYPAGGGLNDVKIPAGGQDTSLLLPDMYRDTGYYYYVGTINFDSNSTSDLSMWAPHTTKKVCDKINQKLGIGPATTKVTIALNARWGFRGSGTYQNWGTNVGQVTTDADLNGKKMGCITSSSTTNDSGYSALYNFYIVLISR